MEGISVESGQGVNSRQYVVNAPVVVGEIIDDEAVILNLQSGLYFNTAGSGAEIWAGLDRGATVEALAGRLTARFDIAPAEAAGAVAAFLATLETYELVRSEPADPGKPRITPAATGTEAFTPPGLGTHSDLDDLLRLDPIHDVDQMGWPIVSRPA
jgi:hypothetical protein